MITEKQRAEIKKLREKGFSMGQIGEQVGVSKATVSSYLTRDKPKGGITVEQRNKIKELYDAGVSMSEIANDVGVAVDTVRKYSGHIPFARPCKSSDNSMNELLKTVAEIKMLRKKAAQLVEGMTQ